MMQAVIIVGGVAGGAVVLSLGARLVWGLWSNSAARRAVDGFYERHSKHTKMVATKHGGNVLVLNANPDAPNEKPALFFVHGSCARMGQFEHQIDHFISKGHHVGALDNLGCGYSDKPRSHASYHPEQFVDTAVDVINEIFRPDEQVVIIGHSFGSFISFKAAERVPIIAGSVHIGSAPLWQDNDMKAKLQIFKIPLPLMWLIRPLLGMNFQKVALAKATPKQLREQEAEASARNPIYMFTAFYLNMMSLAEGVKHPVMPSHPVLFISGLEDKITPPEKTEILVELHGAAVHKVVVDASHQVMQEKPHDVNFHMEEFFCKQLAMMQG